MGYLRASQAVIRGLFNYRIRHIGKIKNTKLSCSLWMVRLGLWLQEYTPGNTII